MAITLITPAEEWVAGATVQFKFDRTGSAVNRDTSWTATTYYTTALLGIARRESGSWTHRQNRVFWSLDEMLAYISWDALGINKSHLMFGACELGQNILDSSDASYVNNSPDPYARVTAVSPSYDAADGLHYTETGQDSITTWSVKMRLVLEDGEDGSEVVFNNILYLSFETIGEAQAYIEENQWKRTVHWYHWERNQMYRTLAWRLTLSAQTVHDESPEYQYLAPHEVTVTMIMLQNLPPGGLFLFAPTVAAAWTGTFWSIWQSDYSGAEDTEYASGYDCKLIRTTGAPLWWQYISIAGGMHTITHDGLADLTIDGEFLGEVYSARIAPEFNEIYTYQWGDEDERKVQIVAGVSDRPMQHQIAGKQRAGDTIWRP